MCFLSENLILVTHHVEEKTKAPDVPVETPKEQPLSEEPTPRAEPPASSWRSWGAFNVISNASKTVASITTQVSQSISTAIDSMNIPDPEEMAKLHAEQQKTAETPDSESVNEEKSSEKSDDSRFKLDSLLSNVSQISSKVVSGGLDTLEGIGKKTINILQETDPNIKNKIRSMNVSSKPNLSDLLKEAKERDEDVAPSANAMSLKKVSFEHLLDEHKGLVFLEALEILSSQSSMKIEQLMKPLSGRVLTEMEETLAEVKELCELDADSFDETLTVENLEEKLLSATEDLSVKINFNEIVTNSKEAEHWLEDLNSSALSSSIYEKSIDVMAKTCALSLNNFQKLAELLLSQDHRSTADESDSVSRLASIYCSLFNHFAIKFTEKLTAQSTNNEIKKMATNLFLEVSLLNIFYFQFKNSFLSIQSSNAISYVKKAFNLFIPVLQIGAV